MILMQITRLISGGIFNFCVLFFGVVCIALFAAGSQVTYM